MPIQPMYIVANQLNSSLTMVFKCHNDPQSLVWMMIEPVLQQLRNKCLPSPSAALRGWYLFVLLDEVLLNSRHDLRLRHNTIVRVWSRVKVIGER